MINNNNKSTTHTSHTHHHPHSTPRATRCPLLLFFSMFSSSGSFSPEAVLSSSRQLFDACKGGDMFGALWSLAHGADVNWANPEADGATAVCTVSNVVQLARERRVIFSVLFVS